MKKNYDEDYIAPIFLYEGGTVALGSASFPYPPTLRDHFRDIPKETLQSIKPHSPFFWGEFSVIGDSIIIRVFRRFYMEYRIYG